MSELVPSKPGTLVDIYRRPNTKDTPGWRGPASLIDVNEMPGTAIVTWQGRPYCLPLRHVRPHKGFAGAILAHATVLACFENNTPNTAHLTHLCRSDELTVHSVSRDPAGVTALMHIMDLADAAQYGKLETHGKLWIEQINSYRILPEGTDLNTPVHKFISTFCQSHLDGYIHDGVKFGTCIPRIPPMHHCMHGVILCWDRRNRANSFQQLVNPSLGISVRQLCGSRWNEFSVLLIYSYSRPADEHEETPIIELGDLPGNPHSYDDDFAMWETGSESVDHDNPMSSPDEPMNSDIHLPDNDPDTDMDNGPPQTQPKIDPDSDRSRSSRGRAKKREKKAPSETPTITCESDLPTRSKKDESSAPDSTPESHQDLEPLLPLQDDNTDLSGEADPSTDETREYSDMENQIDLAWKNLHQEIQESVHTFLGVKTEIPETDPVREMNISLKLDYPGSQSTNFFWSIGSGEVLAVGSEMEVKTYRVDSMTDNLSAEEMVTHEHLVREADVAEIKSFLNNNCWSIKHHSECNTNPVDCTWVRKWKMKTVEGKKKKIVKSRLCARGFLDSQKNAVSKFASTASRLSQKLLVSYAALHNLPLESWDISTAFLQGLSFKEVDEHARALGIASPVTSREVVLMVPGNVLFILDQLGFLAQYGISLEEMRNGTYLLCCEKSMYGLVDAPALWSLCFRSHMQLKLKAEPSHFDENFFMTRDPHSGMVVGLTTSHVDDLGVTGTASELKERKAKIESRFGKMSEHTLPFEHVGIEYSRTSSGLLLCQRRYVLQIKTTHIPRSRKPEDKCTSAETHELRAIIGALLYACITRIDIQAGVTALAQRVNCATLADLRSANNLVLRAKSCAHFGLHFPFMKGPFRLMNISDASFATKGTSYAIEGIIIALVPDKISGIRNHGLAPSEVRGDWMSSQCHVLYSASNKAKRVSHSTSHAESLAMVSSVHTSITLALRLEEQSSIYPLSLDEMIDLQDCGRWQVPIDIFSDCYDLIQLLTGSKGVPQDKTQRLIVLSLREKRIQGKTNYVVHLRTTDMVANSLTKVVLYDKQLSKLMTGEGLVFEQPWTIWAPLIPTDIYDEHDLMSMS